MMSSRAPAFGGPTVDDVHESFFAAQIRHRRSARRWGWLMTLVVGVVTWVVSLLLAPITLVVAGLVLDLVNLVLPMPDLLGWAFATVFPDDGASYALTAGHLIVAAALAALPGFAVLTLVWLRLGRTVMAGNHAALVRVLNLRVPANGDLEERQLGNVVAEMAIAARVTPPRLLLHDSAACNLGLVGTRDRQTLVVTRGVVDRLDRAETQALVGQAIAALGNGDGRLALRMLQLDAMIGLLGLLARTPVDAAARRALRPLLRRDEDSALAALRATLGAGAVEPPRRAAESDSAEAPKPDESAPAGGGWRSVLWMPLTGSLMIGMLLVPIATALLVAPLNGVIWRRRRLLADATAVQFTRDPQALAEAYAALAKRQTALGSAIHGLGDLFLLDSGSHSNLRLGSPYPSLRDRIVRLNAMGASVAPPARAPKPWWFWPVAVAIGVVVVGLCGVVVVLGTWLSLALNGLFLAMPAAVLHYLLRSLAG